MVSSIPTGARSAGISTAFSRSKASFVHRRWQPAAPPPLRHDSGAGTQNRPRGSGGPHGPSRPSVPSTWKGDRAAVFQQRGEERAVQRAEPARRTNMVPSPERRPAGPDGTGTAARPQTGEKGGPG